MKKLKDTELGRRLQLPTPKFWKKVVRAGVFIGSVAGAIVLLPVLFPIVLPAALLTVAGYGIAVGATSVTVAKFAKIDISDIPGMPEQEKVELLTELENKNKLNGKERELKYALQADITDTSVFKSTHV